MDLEKIADNYNARGFRAVALPSGQAAREYVLSLIPRGASVGMGGCMSAAEIGLDKALPESGRPFFSRAAHEKGAAADWFISSANAATEDGDLVNIDGSGNRVSALLYGVPNVVYIVGKNKIVPDLAAAVDRVRNVAAPKNAVRLKRETPCAQTGKCSYCNCEQCMCNATVIVHHPMRYQQHVCVLLVDEELGL